MMDELTTSLKGHTFKNDRYVVIDNLVENGAIKSYMVEDKLENNSVKVLRIVNSTEIDRDFLRNIENLKNVSSEFVNVIYYHDYFKIKFNHYFILEYFDVSFRLVKNNFLKIVI
jgi:hypothetical protein